jgi:hypothetical protein
MYRVPPPGEHLWQSDIFHGRFVFPYNPNPAEDVPIVRDDRIQQSAEVEGAWGNGSEIVTVPAYFGEYAILLTNTCEISGPKPPLELVTVAKIFPLAEIPSDETRENCRRRNSVIRFHYLPEHAESGLFESFANFGVVATVSRDALLEMRASRILTLESPYRESLSHRYGEFVSRVALQ